MDLSTAKKRFFQNIKVTENNCWEWQKSRTLQGYGKFKFQKQQLAHRVSWMFHYGPIPNSDVCVLHKCDNPPCVNPEHLFVGSRGDNNKDRAQKGRTVIFNSLKTHCKRGHEFTEENTYRRKDGKRLCLQCNNDRSKNNYRSDKEAKGLVVGTPNKNKTHCKRGHEFTEENTYLLRNGRQRQCRTCNKLRQQGLL